MPTRFSLVQRAADTGFTRADWIVGCLGISAATVSASFAAYMVVISPGAPILSPNLPDDISVYTALDRRPRRGVAIAAVQPAVPDPAQLLHAKAGGGAEIDFTPTGSIAAAANPRRAAPDAWAPGQRPGPAEATAAPLPNFVLRDVFDGKALVETRNKLRLVEPGSVLEGAGAVLAIRRRGDAWVVDTAAGTIE